MAIRDAGDYGFGLSFEEAVAKGRRENWSDRDIAALLKCTEEEVTRVPREKVAIRLEDLKFRPDVSEGGMVVEYLVDGRKKPQTIHRVVGEVLESLVNMVVANKVRIEELEEKIERLEGTTRGNGDGRPAAGPKRSAGKGKAKAHAKARKGS